MNEVSGLVSTMFRLIFVMIEVFGRCSDFYSLKHPLCLWHSIRSKSGCRKFYPYCPIPYRYLVSNTQAIMLNGCLVAIEHSAGPAIGGIWIRNQFTHADGADWSDVIGRDLQG